MLPTRFRSIVLSEMEGQRHLHRPHHRHDPQPAARTSAASVTASRGHPCPGRTVRQGHGGGRRAQPPPGTRRDPRGDADVLRQCAPPTEADGVGRGERAAGGGRACRRGAAADRPQRARSAVHPGTDRRRDPPTMRSRRLKGVPTPRRLRGVIPMRTRRLVTASRRPGPMPRPCRRVWNKATMEVEDDSLCTVPPESIGRIIARTPGEPVTCLWCVAADR